jgi:beta-lactamase regulating signal transducer with metallopeptidase domain
VNLLTGQLIEWASIQLVVVESLKIVLLTALAVLLVKSEVWKRNLWHGSVVALIVLCFVEYFGLSRWITSAFQNQFVVRAIGEPTQLVLGETTYSAGSPVLVSLIWALGSVYFALGFLVQRFKLNHLLKNATACSDEDLQRMCESHRIRLGIRSEVKLVTSSRMPVPAAAGVLQRIIVLPRDFAVTLERNEQESVIIHELGHHRANDPLWQLLMNVMISVLWWNPLVWWLRAQALRHSENAADETSTILPEGPVHLAGSLVKLGRQFTGLPRIASSITGRGKTGELLQRVQRMLELPPDSLFLPDPFQSAAIKLCYGLTLVIFAVLCFH